MEKSLSHDAFLDFFFVFLFFFAEPGVDVAVGVAGVLDVTSPSSMPRAFVDDAFFFFGSATSTSASASSP